MTGGEVLLSANAGAVLFSGGAAVRAYVLSNGSFLDIRDFQATDFNNNTVVIGPWWRWTKSGGLEQLGHEGQRLCGINDDGTVVGSLKVVSPTTVPHWAAMAMWSGQVVDLNVLFPPGTPHLARFAVDLNSNGQIIAQGSRPSGESIPLLLTPQAPKLSNIRELATVVAILTGVRNDGRGVVIPPGRGPEPAPPWTGRDVMPLPGAMRRAQLFRALGLVAGGEHDRELEALVERLVTSPHIVLDVLR